jgi:hypothetical protein
VGAGSPRRRGPAQGADRSAQAPRRDRRRPPVPFTPAKPQNRRPKSEWTGYRKEFVESVWEEVTRGEEKRVEGVEHLTWYQATRHSFVSRNLKAGASFDEVSAAVSHSSPLVTKRFYDHYIRRTFSNALRGLAN